MQTVDAMGKACPTPVIMTRRALRDNDVVVPRVSEEIKQQQLLQLVMQRLMPLLSMTVMISNGLNQQRSIVFVFLTATLLFLIQTKLVGVTLR